ncbi:NTP transferase domain-containing protein, partial [Gordonia sp. (in: high G+C Gram-positive bacteria)]|uniref:NTP transferase domain-containing protein n=1 Tax=Gordonia sp. (in: high G+C Gram-positive bacteria) TaxID=84139 RepID=UPI0039E4C5BD
MEGVAWGAVLAVKPLPEAKSRLTGAVGDRSSLVLAMLADVLAATSAAGVTALVVTPDPRIAAAAAAAGAHTADEPVAGGGLNAAFVHGQHELTGRIGAVDGVVLLQADLPALTAADLRSAITAHEATTAEQTFVADLAGTGTSALLRPAAITRAPLFGADSAARHRGAGVAE